MLLEAILKYSERAGLTEEATAIQSAFRVMQTTPKAANEMMDVGRLQGFEVLICYGSTKLYTFWKWQIFKCIIALF